MSQTPKKPGGARDISDLKARLGLKKGGAAPKARPASGSVPPPMGGGGVVPPPTAAKSPAVPAPPGATPPRAAQPATPAVHIPDAKQDPFGAMNAMAAASTAAAPAAAQDFVIVNDGRPVETVGKQSSGLTWAKRVAVALVPLIIGVVLGQIGTNASIYNQTIESAQAINGKVSQVNKDLQGLRDILYTNKTHGADGAGYKLADTELTTALSGFTGSTELPDLQPVYESYMYELDAATVDQIFAFFTDYKQLYAELKTHAQQAANDAKAIQFASERVQKFGGPSRYAVYIDLPKKGKGAGALTTTFVELGDPICSDDKPNPEGCGGDTPKGFLYRTTESGPWGKFPLATTEDYGVKRLMPLGFTPSPALNTLFQGGEASVAGVTYMRRINDIDARVDDLMKRGKDLQKALISTANKGKKFTFFQ